MVHASWPLAIKRIDLSGHARCGSEAEVERLLIDEPRLPYHLDREPGIRATLIAPRRSRACLHPDDASSGLRLGIGRSHVARIVGGLSRDRPG